MERDETKSLIERYGGKVTGNISKKTTYLVQGRDSGVSKLEKVKNVSESAQGQNNNEWDYLYLTCCCGCNSIYRRRVWAQRSWTRTVCWSWSEPNRERNPSTRSLPRLRLVLVPSCHLIKFYFFLPFVLLRCYRLLCCCYCVFSLSVLILLVFRSKPQSPELLAKHLKAPLQPRRSLLQKVIPHLPTPPAHQRPAWLKATQPGQERLERRLEGGQLRPFAGNWASPPLNRLLHPRIHRSRDRQGGKWLCCGSTSTARGLWRL